MSNFNKVVTNIPVSLTETEMSNLSQTLSGVIQGGGGGGEGKRYIGDGVYVTVNNDANPGIIALTQTSLEKLNREIPSAVSSYPDSIQYAKKTYVDNTFQTKDDMSAYAKKTDLPDSITDFDDTDEVIYSTYINPLTADIQTQINAKQNKLQFDLNAKGEISAIGTLNNTTALAGANGITGDYYSASNPSGFINSTQAETQILEKHYLTEASGNSLYVPIPEGLSDGQYYAMTTSSWKVIQGAGDVSGISTVAHDDTLTGNGNNENLGVNTNASMNLTNASAKYATIADQYYDVVEGQNFSIATVISNIIEDFDDYYEKTETSGAEEIATALLGKQDKLTFAGESNTITSINNSAIGGGTSFTGVTTAGSISGDGLTYPLGLVTSAENALTSVANKVDLPTTASNKIYAYATTGSTTGWADITNKYVDPTYLSYYVEISELQTPGLGLSGGYSYENGYEVGLTTTAYNAITSVSSKVDNPSTTLADKYLVLRTNIDGTVSGWCDFQDQSYSKTEALGTFVATANIDTTTLSGDGKSVSTKLGVKTDVIATKDYVNSSFLPTSGGTVSGETILSAATGTFDNSYLKCINNSNVGYARFGVGSYGGAVIKTVDSSNNRVQVNVKTNSNNNELISVQTNDNTIGYLIPAVTSTTTAGLTNDGILHIIVES